MSAILHSVLALLGKIVAYLPSLLPFIIVFGILVLVHELGHFVTAKLVGIRVETFSFGFGKKLVGFTRGGTLYKISLVPVGGYVKFLGEDPQPGQALEPDNFMAKTRWQRFLVIVMGAVMNILLALGLFTVVNVAGVDVPAYLEEAPVIGLIDPASPAQKADFRVDDEILRINGRPTPTWQDVEMAIGTNPEKVLKIDIRREGREMTLDLRTEQDKNYRFELGYAGFLGKIMTQVEGVNPGSPAEKGGLKSGDIIRTIDGQPVYYYNVIPMLRKNPERELQVGILRAGAPMDLRITPRREGEDGKIDARLVAGSVQKKYPFFAAAGKSFKDAGSVALAIVDLVKKLFTGQASASKNLGGPIEIATQSNSFYQLGFLKLLWFMAFMSLQLGVINLLPIPLLPLDGTQIFILGLEGVLRRDLNAKLKQVWTNIMFFAFMALFAFLILNDIFRRLPHGWKSLWPF